MPRAHKLSAGGVKLLQEKHLAVIATVMPDGSPLLEGETRVILRIKRRMCSSAARTESEQADGVDAPGN